MRKIALALPLILFLTGCSELESILKHAENTVLNEPVVKDQLSNEEIIKGLKDALIHGTDTAVATLSAKGGYFENAALKIFLPQEAKPVFEKLEKIPILNSYIDDAILSINRAAEDASPEAKPIFIDAIRTMTITEALSILQGHDSAATIYLREKTYNSLYEAYLPKIQQSLSKEYIKGISAENSYKRIIDTYNKASLNGVLFDKIEGNSLSEHTTKKALDGLFIKVASEEQAIRENPIHRVTDILQRVFGWEF